MLKYTSEVSQLYIMMYIVCASNIFENHDVFLPYRL